VRSSNTEETGQNPRRERTKKMKLKAREKKNKQCNRRTEELQNRKKAKTHSVGKIYLGGDNTKAVKVTAR
jgi:hypothetical protein